MGIWDIGVEIDGLDYPGRRIDLLKMGLISKPGPSIYPSLEGNVL